MAHAHDLGALTWRLAGFTPHFWQAVLRDEWLTAASIAEVASLPARVPGSVQQALLEAGALPDWNVGMNALQCEWVEHRHWVYEAELPASLADAPGEATLRCAALDYSGWLYVGSELVAEFRGGHAETAVPLGPARSLAGRKLRLIFACPPGWLGYTGFTSQFTRWKARFSYSWDWMVRLVTLGVGDELTLEVTDGPGLDDPIVTAEVDADGSGRLMFEAGVRAAAGATLRLRLTGPDGLVREAENPATGPDASVEWRGLPVRLWHPNGQGEQPLYTLEAQLLDASGRRIDALGRRVGFKRVAWEPCAGAPPEATPWLCVVNGRPTFLQGINWTPIRPNFHDVRPAQYRRLLEQYRDAGVNCLRVWGGGVLEKPCFYDLCDEMGLLVWQEFPLSSSTFDNWPPGEPAAVAEMRGIAASWVKRLRGHASLLMWCGGNELSRAEGEPLISRRIPVDFDHPMIAALADVVAELDPGRRFAATSPYGPEFFGDEADTGQGKHWDVHGPWRPDAGMDAWRDIWQRDDALIRTEVGRPGASTMAILEAYAAPDATVRPTPDAPRFRRQFDAWWWAEWAAFEAEASREPLDTPEFVTWSQARQAEALAVAARACKERFPACGGFILWMGHDSFPCTANTSVIDFHGDPKPALAALAEVFRG